MTSLVSRSVASLGAPPLERSRQKARGLLLMRNRGRDGQGTLFLVASLAVHVGVLVFFSSLPESAHAAGERPVEVEIAFEELALPPEVQAPEPLELPLGNLDAPVAPAKASAIAPSTADSVTPERPPAAPTLIATDNPYASSDASVFTAGLGDTAHSAKASVRVTHLGNSAASFGVETGSERSSLERQKELSAWYSRVQGQLAQLAARDYPRRALTLKQEGTARVTVRINGNGHILGAELRTTSGVASLDDSALRALRAVTGVAAPPTGTGSTSLTVPVTFRIR